MGDATATYNGGPIPNDQAVDIDQLIAANAISFDSPLTSDGGQQTIDWTFDPQAADLDWLKKATPSNSRGPLKSTTAMDPGRSNALTITIGGTNDLPTIDASTDPLPLAELPDDSSAQDIAPTTGTIKFTDQDLGDSIAFSVTGDATATYTRRSDPNDSAAVDIDQLIAANAISSNAGLTSDGGQQTIDWTFDPQAADLDWLKEGDTLELTWTAQINDGHGIQGAEQLTITIGGTNDIPTIDASTNPLDIAELGDSSAQDIAPTTGTIKFTDQDLGD